MSCYNTVPVSSSESPGKEDSQKPLDKGLDEKDGYRQLFFLNATVAMADMGQNICLIFCMSKEYT